MVIIRKIDVGSAARVGAILSGLITAVFGLPVVLLQSALLSLFSVSIQNVPELEGVVVGGVSLLSLLCGWLVFVVVGAIFGAIYFAVGAFLYNVTSGWIGGLRIDLARVRTYDDDPFADIEDEEPRKRGM